MTLKHYSISKPHQSAVRRSGFDCHDVNKRYPVQNLEINKVLGSKSQTLDPRARLLLKGREMFRDFKDRALILASGMVLTAALPPEAWATSAPSDIDGQAMFVAALLEAATWPWELVFLGALLISSLFTLRLQSKTYKMNTPPQSNLTRKQISKSKKPIHAEPVAGDIISPALELSVDGASRVGRVRSENQDAFDFWRVSEDEVFMVVCDGAGGLPGGKEAAETAVQVIIMTLQGVYSEAGDPAKSLEIAIEDARSVAEEHSLPGITTAIVAHVKGNKLTYATLGDGTLSAVWTDGMVNHIQTPHHVQGQPSNIIAAYIGQDCDVPPRTGSLRLEVGTFVMLMSDGASDLFPFEDFAAHRFDYAEILDSESEVPLADKLLEQIEGARDPETDAYLHHDNMTLILAHLHEVSKPVELNNG